MAHFGVPFIGAESFAQPPPDFATFHITTTNQAAQDNETDEWEYEYSTTETEIYYVTLDLTTPEVDPKRKPPKARENRVVKTKWTNPGLGRNKRSRQFKPATYSAISSSINKDEDDDGGDDDVEKEDDEEDRTPTPDTPQKNYTDMPTEVQILDLNTTNPLVSYHGHMYSCQWAKNIGTELLFTAHDTQGTIPTLRTLVGGVDLLATSSARIISKCVEVEKRKEQSSDRVSNKSGQASFLERLINIKEEKGETDLVTMHSRKRPTNPQWRKQWKAMRDTERAKLEDIISRNTNQNLPTVMDAKTRLATIDEQDKKIEQVEASNGRYPGGGKQNPQGRKSKGVSLDNREPGAQKVFKRRKLGTKDKITDEFEDREEVASTIALSPVSTISPIGE